MSAILKTLPARFARGQLERFLGLDGKPCWTTYFFTLGRARPSKANVFKVVGSFQPSLESQGIVDGWTGIDRLYFTHRGIVLGHFGIWLIVQNVGQLPKLTTLDGDPSEWQIKLDRWVAVCRPPFRRLAGPRIYHEAFRGWRYFDLEAYRGTTAAKVRL